MIGFRRVLGAGRRNEQTTQVAAPLQPETRQLCTLIEETTRLDPHRKPGQPLSAMIRTIFQMDAVAIFDDDLQEVYGAGDWFDDLQDVLQNICIFETVSDDPETGLSRRVSAHGQSAHRCDDDARRNPAAVWRARSPP
jgi:hypothetical protein